MDVSIIIVNYKTSHLIVNCVKSILALTKDIDYEIIIVDNASERDFEKTISQGINSETNKEILFLSLPENIGFGRANNEGVKKARGRNILFLNPDTILLNNAIKILSDFLDSNPKAGACGGNLFDENLKPTYSYKMLLPGIVWELNDLLNNKIHTLWYGKTNHYFNSNGNIKKVGYITGADLMVKKEVLDETGGFSPDFFMYFEETDLCARIHKAGWSIYSVPEAKIQHLESKSFESSKSWENERKTVMLEESRKIYYNHNVKKYRQIIANFIYSLFLNSRIALIHNPLKKEYYKLRKKSYKSRD